MLSPRLIFLVFLRLGLTSFGGPVAHLSYFHEEFVVRRRWLSEKGYAELIALCQFLPGPASSQVGISIGLLRGGMAGAMAAWLGFTFPSAIALTLFAQGLTKWGSAFPQGILHGLALAAFAVVAQACWSMFRTLCRGPLRQAIAAVTAALLIALQIAGRQSMVAQILVLIPAAVLGCFLLRVPTQSAPEDLPLKHLHRTGSAVYLALFLGLLFGLPLFARSSHQTLVVLAASFYRTGALVFGGGHVVLPLLQNAVIPNGWVTESRFLAGYGAAQAVPGPLFTFAAFLGASIQNGTGGWIGATVALLSIFLPSFLLIPAVLPFWADLRQNSTVQGALGGTNAAVVGLLFAALYSPVGTSALHRPLDIALALAAFLALRSLRLPPWLLVLSMGLAGFLEARMAS